MANTVVATTTNNYAVISQNTTPVVVDGKKPVVVLSGQLGPPGESTLSALRDVDVSTLAPNSLLLYDTVSQKWKAEKKLEDHLVNAGFF